MSNTYTLNFSYGVGLVAEGTGVLLNNELDDFAAKPDAPNAYGLLGYEANEPGPGKRPLSSMTPTIVLKDGKPFLITGSPGGSRIITAVLQIVVNVIDRGMDIARAVSAPRVHNQWMPDQVYVEPALRGRAGRARCRRAATKSCCSGRSRRPIRSWSRPRASSAPPIRAPAARWRRDTDGLLITSARRKARAARQKSISRAE